MPTVVALLEYVDKLNCCNCQKLLTLKLQRYRNVAYNLYTNVPIDTLTHTHTHLPALKVHVIVVATLNGRAIAEAASIVPLHRLTEHVGTGVPEDLLRCSMGREGRGEG